MEIKKIIKTLSDFNKWRKGDESIEQPNAKVISEAINDAIEALELIASIHDAFPEIFKKKL